MGGSFARTGLPAALASAVYDAANRLTQWGGTALAYDLNGNLTSDGVNTYTWNARDQLSSMTRASFQYDAIGRRSGRTVSGATTNYMHDGLNVVKQTGASAGDLLTGLGIDEMFTRTDASGGRHFLTDALGSTLGLADATGQVQTQYTFQPFGAATASGETNANAFQYTGRENDGTGLYYYRARYYHPGFGRFISEDPLAEMAGANLQSYANDSPVNTTDPTGLEGWEHHWMPQYLIRDLNKAELLSKDACEFFKKWTSGPLVDPKANSFHDLHQKYNPRIERMALDFIRERNISPAPRGQMTFEQAVQFANQVRRSTDPVVSAMRNRIGAAGGSTAIPTSLVVGHIVRQLLNMLASPRATLPFFVDTRLREPARCTECIF